MHHIGRRTIGWRICGAFALAISVSAAAFAQAPDSAADERPKITAEQAVQMVRRFFSTPHDMVDRAPFEGWWTVGNLGPEFKPILVSDDGRWIISGTWVYDMQDLRRPQQISGPQAMKMIEQMRARLRPEAALRYGNPVRGDYIVTSDPQCPVCAKLEVFFEHNKQFNAFVIPVVILGKSIPPLEFYSRVMCSKDPVAEFRRSMQSKGRYIPDPVPGCDKRLQAKTILAYYYTQGEIALVPAWFKDGRRTDYDWSYPVQPTRAVKSAP